MSENVVGVTYNASIAMATREIYGKHLAKLGETNPNIVVLTADLLRANKTGDFKKAFPDRFYNIGIAEQNMMGISAGLAAEGFMPFASTFAAFASLRACEQVRTDICYSNLPVRIVATHAGLTSNGGPTHYAQEDVAIMRNFVNMTVISPGDPAQIAKILDASIHHKGPIYIRMGRNTEESVYTEDYDYKIGQAIVANQGDDGAVIAYGSTVAFAVNAAKKLATEGVHIRVIDMHTIKPIDRNAVIEAAKTGFIITAEDHNISGGLGTAVAEVLAEEGIACRIKKLGIPNVYAAVGNELQLYQKYGYDAEGIESTIRELLK